MALFWTWSYLISLSAPLPSSVHPCTIPSCSFPFTPFLPPSFLPIPLPLSSFTYTSISFLLRNLAKSLCPDLSLDLGEQRERCLLHRDSPIRTGRFCQVEAAELVDSCVDISSVGFTRPLETCVHMLGPSAPAPLPSTLQGLFRCAV